jgi:hypothetical protein
MILPCWEGELLVLTYKSSNTWQWKIAWHHNISFCRSQTVEIRLWKFSTVLQNLSKLMEALVKHVWDSPASPVMSFHAWDCTTIICEIIAANLQHMFKPDPSHKFWFWLFPVEQQTHTIHQSINTPTGYSLPWVISSPPMCLRWREEQGRCSSHSYNDASEVHIRSISRWQVKYPRRACNICVAVLVASTINWWIVQCDTTVCIVFCICCYT